MCAEKSFPGQLESRGQAINLLQPARLAAVASENQLHVNTSIMISPENACIQISRYNTAALFLDRARVPLARSSAVGHALSETTVPGVAH